MVNTIDYGRIVYYEPNEIFGGDNIGVSQEDLNKYVNLSVKVPSRYYNPETFKNYDSVLRGTQFNMKNNDNVEYTTFYLTDNYVNVSYNEIRGNGEFSAGELFGIDSIDISFDVQFFPQVTINFTDVKGFGLMSTMEHNYEEGRDLTAKSFFTSLFNFPYPIFTLEVKGYYGKSVSFDLSLLEFHTAFDSQTGNFKTTVKFIGHMYGVYADIPMSYLMVSPYIDYNGELNANSTNNTDPVGETWKNLGSKNSSPTYLYLMRGFNKLLMNINNNDGNYSIINRYVNNIEKKTILSGIKSGLENIIKLCKESKNKYKEGLEQTIYNDNDLLFIVPKADNQVCNLIEKLSGYRDLTTDLTINEFQVYKPRVEEITSVTDYCIWYFPDINTKINECILEIGRLEYSFNDNSELANTILLSAITTNMGITPNIKNVYGMLFKHLNCFSRHFYNTITSIDRNRKLDDVGLSNYITDIPLNNPVPPFPAVYDTQNNERVVKYPGEITKFKGQPEIKLTENIFNSINFFGHQAVNELAELENTRREIDETIITTNGLFFTDGLRNLNGEVLNENLKHYNIIRPSNTDFNSYRFAGEDADDNRYDNNGNITGNTRNAKISETIRDIFLARLATFGRLHYMEGIDYPTYNGEYVAKVEAKLLHDSYVNMATKNEIFNSLRNMISESEGQSAFTINRYHVLSGGTNNGNLWGFINYRPGDEGIINNTDNTDTFETYKKYGHIHSNGYEADTIIVYGSGMTLEEAEQVYSGINFNVNYKLKSDAIFNDDEEEYNVFAELERNENTANSFLFHDPEKSYKFNKASAINDGGVFRDYNWGRKRCLPIGGEETRRFISETYRLYECNYSRRNACSVLTKRGFADCAQNIVQGGITNLWKNKFIKSNVTQKNKITLINACAILSLCENNSSEVHENIGRNEINATGYTVIPAAIIPGTYQKDFTNKFVGQFTIHDSVKNFYNSINNSLSSKTATELAEQYYVFAKNIQYNRTDDHKLTDEKVWDIWKKFVCEVLKSYGLECNETSETIQRELDKKEADKRVKTDIYYTLKALYDKWFSGLDRNFFEIDNEDGEYKKIHYLTTTYNNISETMIVDLESLVNQVGNAVISTDGSANSVIRFMAKTAEDNNSTFLTLPMKLNWGVNDSEIQEIFKPSSFYNGTATHDLHGVSYIVMYNGDVSHHLANERSEFVNDGYDIANYFGGEITASPDAIRLFAKEVKNENQNKDEYKVPAFGVTYGMQNQNFFKNISVDTTNPSVTDYSIANTLTISQQGSLAGVNNSIPSIKSLYPIYANRSYTCSVEMMGCMYITPLMYFQLNNVPLFRGAYIITNVHHRITPNDFTTTFSGVRVSKYKIPINTDAISVTSLLRTTNTRRNNNGSGNSGSGNSGGSFTNDADLQIVLNREVFRPTRTIGRLYVNGTFICYTIEDGIKHDNVCKTTGATHPILHGSYPIKLTASNHFSLRNNDNNQKRFELYETAGCKIGDYIHLPLIDEVPGRAGIRIHMGSDESWSEGCVIVGYPEGTIGDNVTNSVEALTSITCFTRGDYAARCAAPTSFTSYNAFVKLYGIIKDGHDNNKSMSIVINQNLTNDEINNINGGEVIIKILPPPSYTSNNNTGLGECQGKYDRLIAITDWDTFIPSKGMEKIDDDLVEVDLKYSTEDNFADVNMYGTLTNAYVSSGMKTAIGRIVGKLNHHNTNDKIPNETNDTKLIIYDAARPVLAQDFMRCLKDNNIGNKNYPAIAVPATRNNPGGYHQYGSAIDISILGPDGLPLFMGAYFDESGGEYSVAGHMGLKTLITTGITANHSNEAFRFKYGEWDIAPKLTRTGVKNNNAHTYEYRYSKYYVSGITSDNSSINDFLNKYIVKDTRKKIKDKCSFIENDTQANGVLRNRALLILLARTAGLNIEKTEWWHYQETGRTGNLLIRE